MCILYRTYLRYAQREVKRHYERVHIKHLLGTGDETTHK